MNSPCAPSSWRGFQLSLGKQASLPACFGRLVFWLIVTDFLLITSPSLFAQTNDNTATVGGRIAGQARTTALSGNVTTVRGRVTGGPGAVVAGARSRSAIWRPGWNASKRSIPPVSPISTTNGKADVRQGFRGAGDSHTAARELPLEWTDGKTFVMRAGAKVEQLAMNELSGVERVYGVAAVDRALLLRSGRKLIKLSER